MASKKPLATAAIFFGIVSAIAGVGLYYMARSYFAAVSLFEGEANALVQRNLTTGSALLVIHAIFLLAGGFLYRKGRRTGRNIVILACAGYILTSAMAVLQAASAIPYRLFIISLTIGWVLFAVVFALYIYYLSRDKIL